MKTDLASTLKAIETWPVEDQMELVQRVWDRIMDSGWQPAPPDEKAGEVVPWDDAVADARRG